MNEKEKIIKKLKKILSNNRIKILSKNNFKNFNLLNNAMIDSLKLLNVISDIKKTFKIKFTTSFLQSRKISNIENIIDKIIKKK